MQDYDECDLWHCRVEIGDVRAHAAGGEHVRQIGRDMGLDDEHAQVVEVQEAAAVGVDAEAAEQVRVQRDGPEEAVLERLAGRRRLGVGEHYGDVGVDGGAVEDGELDLVAGQRVRHRVHRLQHFFGRDHLHCCDQEWSVLLMIGLQAQLPPLI
jgi:hypothetical protein